MSRTRTRLASRLPWTPRTIALILCALITTLAVADAAAEPASSDVSAVLAKDEAPGDGVPWTSGVDNDADTQTDEDPTINGVDEDGDGVDGEDPALDVIAAGRTQHLPVELAFAAGGMADELAFSATIVGPMACDPRWVLGGEASSVTMLGSLQYSTISWPNGAFAAGQVLTFVRKYSVECPVGAHAFNIYAHAASATGVSDPAPLNNLAENYLTLIATADVDGDGVANDADGCVWAPDAGQVDTDGDGYGDACDADDDGDGFTDEVEQFIGTDSVVACGADAWPPDQTDDGWVTLSDVLAVRPYVIGEEPYDPRFDLNMSGAITILDALASKEYVNTSCG